MKYAVDASIGFKWLVDEPLSDKARTLRDDFRNKIHELISPDIFWSRIYQQTQAADHLAKSAE